MESVPVADIAWSKKLFATLKLGGVWAVPRSGLVFVKTRTGLDVQSAMPLPFELAGNPHDWRTWQGQDFDCIAKRFRAAGLTCEDSQNLIGGNQ